MIRAVCSVVAIVVLFVPSARADWPTCPGGVCPVRAVEPVSTMAMTAAPTLHLPTVDHPPSMLVSVETAPAFPILRAIAEPQPVVAPIRRIAALPVRFVRWLRNSH